MITGITGKVGGGKTLLALTMMLDHFIKGGTCCTNIELDVDAVARYCWVRGRRFHARQYVFLDLRRNALFHRQVIRGIEGWHVLVFIDEAHLKFPAAEYRELRKQFLEIEAFVSQSRKVRIDLYFITQAWSNVWNQLTKQALFIIECRDMRSMKLPLFGFALGGMLGLSWTKRDSATNVATESGRTKIARDVVQCYSTMQVYDDMMAELMEVLPECEPFVSRVGFFQRLLHRGPVLAVRDASPAVTADVVDSPEIAPECSESFSSSEPSLQPESSSCGDSTAC
jgi:hypothetical protein